MQVAFGNGGWVAVDGPWRGLLYLRVTGFRREPDGIYLDNLEDLRIAEIYLDASDAQAGLQDADLRNIPLGRIEAWLRTEAESIARGIAQPSPDLSTLASYYGTRLISPDRAIDAGDWVSGSMLAQYFPDGYTTETEGRHVAHMPHSPRREDRVSEASDYRLTSGPGEDGLSDEFLHSVKRAYDAAVQRGESPNAAIREQLGEGTSLKTVQRWVYTARQRGIMPPGRKGKAG